MKKYPEFFYNLQTVYFVSDYECAFMEKNQFKLEAVPRAVGKDVYVSAGDIEKIFAPYMEVKLDGETAEFEMYDTVVRAVNGSAKINVNGKEMELDHPVMEQSGKFVVPAASFMKTAFGKLVYSSLDEEKPVWDRKNIVVAVSGGKKLALDAKAFTVTAASQDKITVEPSFYSFLAAAVRGKNDGELYKTFWFEEAKKVMPYSVYLPYKYDPKKPSKMVVALHGGGLAEQYIYELSKNKMQYFCEEYNFIFLGPNACTKGSSYGCLIPPHQMGLQNPPKPGYDPKNPFGISDEEIALRELGDKSVMMAIGEVMRDYNIDKDKIFLMGNSMGGIGTFHLPTAHPGFFRAISPSGGCPDLEYFDLAALKASLGGAPVRFVVGTEDHHGFDYLKEGYKLMKKAGIEVDFCVVGGGVHYDSWAYALEGTFKFFDKF